MATSKDKDEPQGGGVAVLEKPKKPAFADDDLVTVLNGWGRLQPGERHFIDKVLFVEGVARNVPYTVVKHWEKGTRADGKHDQIYGRVKIYVLPNEATEPDFCRITGITPMPADRFAAMLTGIDLDALAAQLGAEKLKQLISGLEKHLPVNGGR